MKKVIALLLVLLLLFTFVACQSSEVESDKISETISELPKEPIKIGVLVDLSGDFSLIGIQKLHGAELAVAEINEAGGLLGRQIKIIAPDAQSDTARTQALAKKLILEDEVAVVHGPYTSAAREAIRPIFEQNKTLMFYNNQYEGGVASKYVFATGCVPEQQVVPLTNYLVDNFGKNMYIITADYNFGHINAQWLEKAVTAKGGKVVGTEFAPLTVSQFSSSIQKIQASNPDILMADMVGNTQASFYEQWSTVNVEGAMPMGATGNIGQGYEHKRFAAPSLANMFVTVNYVEEIDTPASNEFKNRWHAMFPDEPYIGMEAESGYDGIYLWAKAVEIAGTTETEAVIEALESGNVSFDAPSGVVTIDPATHHAIRNIYLMRVNENHVLEQITMWEGVEPDWLSKEMGVDLTKSSPNKQYTPLDDN